MILARMVPLKQDPSTEFILNWFNSSTCTVRRLPIKKSVDPEKRVCLFLRVA